jgi:hypothetical protein
MSTSRRREACALATAIGVTSLLVTCVAWAGSQPLIACGQVVSGHYHLEGDLDCTGVVGHGVDMVGRRARLELRGFTISNASAAGVQCRSGCKIIGPGTITGSGLQGLRAGGRMKVSDVTILDNAIGIEASNNKNRGRVIIRGSDIEGNGHFGVYAQRRVKLLDSIVTGNERGVVVDCLDGKYKVKRSTVTGNGSDFDCN